jgi:hypothetical protein
MPSSHARMKVEKYENPGATEVCHTAHTEDSNTIRVMTVTTTRLPLAAVHFLRRAIPSTITRIHGQTK